MSVCLSVQSRQCDKRKSNPITCRRSLIVRNINPTQLLNSAEAARRYIDNGTVSSNSSAVNVSIGMGAQLAGEKNTALLFVRVPQMKIYDTTKTKEYELERFYEGRRESITRMIQVNMEKSLRHPCSQLGINTVVCLQEQKAHAKITSRNKRLMPKHPKEQKGHVKSNCIMNFVEGVLLNFHPSAKSPRESPIFSLFRLSRRH